MKNDRIINAWNKVSPDAAARERMFNKIANSNEHMGQIKVLNMNKKLKVLIPTAACLVAALAIGALAMSKGDSLSESIPSIDIEENAIGEIAPAILEAKIYIPDYDNSALTHTTISIEGNSGALVEVLCKYGVLPQGLAFNNFNIEDNGKVTTDGYTVSKEMGDLILKADLPQAFIDYLNGLSARDEKLVIAAFSNTLIEFYNLKSIDLTIDGESFITARFDFSGGLTWFGPEDIK